MATSQQLTSVKEDKAQLNARVQWRLNLRRDILNVQSSLLEPTSIEVLEEASLLLQPSHYAEVVEERAINGYCGHPICDKRINLEKNQSRVFVDPDTGVTLDRAKRPQYCSKICFVSSEFFCSQLSEEPVHLRTTQTKAKVWTEAKAELSPKPPIATATDVFQRSLPQLQQELPLTAEVANLTIHESTPSVSDDSATLLFSLGKEKYDLIDGYRSLVIQSQHNEEQKTLDETHSQLVVPVQEQTKPPSTKPQTVKKKATTSYLAKSPSQKAKKVTFQTPQKQKISSTAPKTTTPSKTQVKPQKGSTDSNEDDSEDDNDDEDSEYTDDSESDGDIQSSLPRLTPQKKRQLWMTLSLFARTWGSLAGMVTSETLHWMQQGGSKDDHKIATLDSEMDGVYVPRAEETARFRIFTRQLLQALALVRQDLQIDGNVDDMVLDVIRTFRLPSDVANISPREYRVFALVLLRVLIPKSSVLQHSLEIDGSRLLPFLQQLDLNNDQLLQYLRLFYP